MAERSLIRRAQGIAVAPDHECMGLDAERRELLTEVAAAGAFLVAAGGMWAGLGAPVSGWSAVWLALLCAVLVRVEFQLEEGHTRPVVLAVVPMLALLPAPLVPLVVAAAHVIARVPDVVARRAPARRLIMMVADCWFAIPPAAIVAWLGIPASTGEVVALVAAAALAQITGDFAVSALRLWAALGLSPRGDLRAYAWVYLVDLLLLPVALLAAAAGRADAIAVAAVLPLALLIAVFARERRGRIENARALQRLTEESRDRLQSIVQNSSDMIVIVEPDGAVRGVSGSIGPVFGRDLEAAQRGSLLDRVHPDDVAHVARFLALVATKAAAESAEAEWRLRYADGSFRHVSAVATNLLGDEHIGGLVLTARDVEERKAFEEQLRHRAFHDELTGLANRALFFDRVEHALMQAARADAQAAVLFIDLDDFKLINDRLGHAAGDAVLQEVATRLRACVRAGDTVARLGGDEFGVLLEGIAAARSVQAGERVLNALSAPIEIAGEAVTVSASVGVAVSEAGVGDVEELLHRGDLAMYDAKRNGKRRLAVYAPEMSEADRQAHRPPVWFAGTEEHRAEVVSVLEDPDALTIVFQPIVDLRNGRVAGYEALTRFNRTPYRPPDQWFAKAHRSGLGYALEAKALAAALAVPGRPAGTYLALNLSPSSLIDSDVRAALPVRLDGIVIEITENELVSSDPALKDAIADLRERGARIAVDDAGAGYAGLTHVMRLAPDIIKLDRNITSGLDTDPVKAALVSSFVRYARDIEATILGEGIETIAELTRLAELDVAFGQGYLIARPAAEWPSINADVPAACRTSLRAAFSSTDTSETQDRRLERLTGLLVRASSLEDLDSCLPALSAELSADHVRVLAGAPQAAHQVLASDPDANPAQIREMLADGHHAMLSFPIGSAGRLQAYRREERPWTRFHIGRARILAHQLEPVLGRLAIDRRPRGCATSAS
jgi:diguanylate cyclase (GGDEF)-like protein/PAS domain S-box-containing protein